MQNPTRERLLRAANDLFYSKGFLAVGVDEIIAAVGVTKTTFYNHFRSKEELVREVLRWHDRWWQLEFRALLRRHGGDSPRRQLLALPDAMEEIVAGEGYNGCFFVNVAVQFPLPHDPAHRAAAAHKSAMADLLRELAGYAGAPHPAALADELCLVLEGAYVTSQIRPSAAVVEPMRRVVTDILHRHLGPGAGPSP